MHNGIHVVLDDPVLVSVVWVEQEREGLVKEHIAGGDIVEQWCVGEREFDVTVLLMVLMTRAVRGVGVVGHAHIEDDVCIAVCDVVVVEGLEGDASKNVRNTGHGIGQASECCR